MRNFFVQMMIIFLLFFCCGYKLFVCLAISHLCWMVAVVEFVVCDLKVIQASYIWLVVRVSVSIGLELIAYSWKPLWALSHTAVIVLWIALDWWRQVVLTHIWTRPTNWWVMMRYCLFLCNELWKCDSIYILLLIALWSAIAGILALVIATKDFT